MCGTLPHLHWRLVEESELAGAVPAGLEPAKSALPPLDAATFQRLQTAVTWQYPFRPATEIKAKTSVTALRRIAVEYSFGPSTKAIRRWPSE